MSLCSCSHSTHCTKRAILSLYILRCFFCPSLPLCTGPLRWWSDAETWSAFHASFCENNRQTADLEQPDPPLPQKRWLSGVCLRQCARVSNSRGERQKCWDKRIHGQFRFHLNIWVFHTKQLPRPSGNTQHHRAVWKSFHSMEVNWGQCVHICPPNWCVTLYRKQQKAIGGERQPSRQFTLAWRERSDWGSLCSNAAQCRRKVCKYLQVLSFA